jgi:hypothetical protein
MGAAKLNRSSFTLGRWGRALISHASGHIQRISTLIRVPAASGETRFDPKDSEQRHGHLLLRMSGDSSRNKKGQRSCLYSKFSKPWSLLVFFCGW